VGTGAREIVLEEKACGYAEENGWLVRKVVYAGRKGAPDRWFFKHGRLVLIEFKRRGEAAKPWQAREHEKLRAHGFKVWVVDTWEGFLKALEG